MCGSHVARKMLILFSESRKHFVGMWIMHKICYRPRKFVIEIKFIFRLLVQK